MGCKRAYYALGSCLTAAALVGDTAAFTAPVGIQLYRGGRVALPPKTSHSCSTQRRRPACFARCDDAPRVSGAEGQTRVQPLFSSPAAGASSDKTGQSDGADAGKGLGKVKGYPGAIYKFTRPHTIRGTVLASVTGVARCLIETRATISMQLVPRAFLGMVALLLGNAYIVGINQIYDVDIDKINKPELPIASGEMSKRLAWLLVLGSLSAGPYIVYRAFSPLIFRLYMFGLTIGGLYSVPPFQFKRFPLMAGLTIACVRGFLLNFGVYHAVREALGLSFRWNPAVLFLARFMTVFAGVIAVTKDLPDVKGDREYNISTFASKRGVKSTARAACAVLGLNYVSAMAQGALSPAGAFNRKVMVGGHALLLAVLGMALRKLDPESQDSVKGFYKRIWDLFYLEYAMYPFM